MMPTMPSTERLLLEHRGWLRQLAGHLVSDPHEADDLVQTAALTVLMRQPRSASNVRAWLRTVVYSVWHNRNRDQRRRRLRERAAARPEATPDTVDVIVRGQRVRALVEAVCALDEPFRRTVMLRYFDELPPRRIAEQLGLPVATVHSRLHRGLERLRAALDERHGGDRAAWSLPLTTFAQSGADTWTLVSLGALLMTTKAKIAIAILAALGVATAWSLRGEPEAPVDANVAAAEPEARRSRPMASATTPRPAHTSRTAVETAGEAPAAAPAAAVDLVRGRVLDADARPRAGIAIEFRGATAGPGDPARSDADGYFTSEVLRVEGRFVAASPGVVTVYAGHHAPGSRLEPVVIVADQRPIAGRVLDPDGLSIAAATVAVELAPEFDARFQISLEASQRHGWRTRTDADGGFSLPTAPAAELALIRTTAAGYEPDLRPMPPAPDLRMLVTLRPVSVSSDAISGRVVGPAGAGVAGAYVAIGPRATARSGPDGRFSLEIEDASGDELLAVAPGFLPGRLPANPGAQGRMRWPEFAIVRLAGEPLSLRGRVVDGRGRPILGARVWPANPEFIGFVDRSVHLLENVLAGVPTAAEHLQVLRNPPAGFDPLAYFNSATDGFHAFVETDSGGHFRLPGLLAKQYELVVMEPGNLLQATFGPYPAGDDGLELVMPDDRCLAVVEGQVLARDGTPVEGVTVVSTTEVARAVYACRGIQALAETNIVEGPDGPRTTVRRTASGQRQVTDAAGRFRFERVPRADVYFALGGDQIIDQTFSLAGIDDPTVLRIEVSRRIRFRVRLPEPGAADSFEILDTTGEPLLTYEIRGRRSSWWHRVRLLGVESPVYSVSEHATEVVFYRGDAEVRRQSLALELGLVNVVW